MFKKLKMFFKRLFDFDKNKNRFEFRCYRPFEIKGKYFPCGQCYLCKEQRKKFRQRRLK